MQQPDVTRIIRAILAVGSLTAASVCVGAGHIVSGARIKGVTFAMEKYKTEAYFDASMWLFIFGAALFVAACVLAVLALRPSRPPAA